MTRIALFTGATILAKGLDSVLRKDGTFELMPACCSISGLLAQVAEDVPDIILLDHTSDVTFALLAELRSKATGARLVLWVDAITTKMAMQAMELGIRGILRKRLPADLQLKCLKRVHAGEVWFEKALTEPLVSSRRTGLTGREEELVSLLSQGLTNREIAGSLTISEGTVRVHLSQLFRKLGVKDRFELALFGLRNSGSRSSAGPAPVFPPAALEESSAEEGALKGLPLPLLTTLQ